MNKPIEAFIKPGIVHFMIFPGVLLGEGPILETIEKIAEDPWFRVIEISWIRDPAVREKAAKMIRSSGLEVKYGAQPRQLSQKLDINSADEDERERALADILAAIDEAASIGITDIALLSGFYPGIEGREAAMDYLETSLSQICLYAKERSMSIVLEVFDQTVDKKALIGQASDAREIAERVCKNHSNFGLLVDLSHIPLLGESPAEALRPVQEYVRHIHIGNCYMRNREDPAYGDMHPRFGYPGGENDVDEIVEFLKELFHIGYLKSDGKTPMPVSFEIRPVGDERPEVVIANAKRKLSEAWQKLEV